MSSQSYSCSVLKLDECGLIQVGTNIGNYWVQPEYFRRVDGSAASREAVKVGVVGTVRTNAEGYLEAVILQSEEVGLSMQSIRKRFSGGVLVYSRDIFPVSVLREDYSASPSVLSALDLISLRCPGLRKCAAGDETGFWKAFRVAFVDYLARKTTPTTKVREVINRASNMSRLRDLPTLVETLEELETKKEAGNAGMEWIAEKSKAIAFWDSMVMFLQQCVARSIHERPDYSAMMGDMDPTMIELSLIDPSYMELFARVLAETFELKIVVFSPQITLLKQSYAAEREGQRLAVVYLLRDGGLYYVLYSQAQLDCDNYDLREMCIKTEGRTLICDTVKLYFTTKARNTIKSHIAEDIMQHMTSVSAMEALCLVLQEYICAVQSTIKTRKAVNFYTPELAKSTLSLMEEYNSHLSRLCSFPEQTTHDFARSLVEKLKEGRLQHAFHSEAIFQQINVCDFCQREPASVVLECNHVFCREHINAHIQASIEKNELLLRVNGETTEDFRCPLLSCFVKISGAKLREIVGEDYFAQYITFVEARTGTKCCSFCRRLRTHDSFMPFCTCSSAVCLHCYCDCIRRNAGYCTCGAKLGDEAGAYLTNLTSMCAGCHGHKSLLRDFSHIECDGHQLCHECLYSVTAQRGSKRCSYCYRLFTLKEVQDAQQLYQKICAFCGQECSKTRLNTECGCVICLNCARDMTVKRQQCVNCFLCGRILPLQGYNQLFVFLPEEVKEEEIIIFTCQICAQDIQEADRLVLPCEDILHKECFEEYAAYQAQANSSEQALLCPMRLCRKPLNIIQLQTLITPQLYGKLYDNMMKGKLTPCPKCKTLVLNREDNGSKKTNVLCQNCKFHFCTECNGEYRQGHDRKKCKFTQIQELVRLAEQTSGPTDIIAQCPSCKYPFFHTSGCHNVVCKVQGCNTKFCVLCSIPYCLYQSHGRAWHRPSCRHYNRDDRKPNKNDNCRACVTLKRACAPPTDLRVPRRFGLDEY